MSEVWRLKNSYSGQQKAPLVPRSAFSAGDLRR